MNQQPLPANSHRPAAIGRLWSWHRISIYAALGLTALTGLIYFGSRDLFAVQANSSDRIVLVLHGIGGFLALMALGSVLPSHVRATWKAHRNRLSGMGALLPIAVLCISALGLYYGSEETHELFKWSHIVLGLAATLLFPLHIFLGRRASRRKKTRLSGQRQSAKHAAAGANELAAAPNQPPCTIREFPENRSAHADPEEARPQEVESATNVSR